MLGILRPLLPDLELIIALLPSTSDIFAAQNSEALEDQALYKQGEE